MLSAIINENEAANKKNHFAYFSAEIFILFSYTSSHLCLWLITFYDDICKSYPTLVAGFYFRLFCLLFPREDLMQDSRKRDLNKKLKERDTVQP